MVYSPGTGTATAVTTYDELGRKATLRDDTTTGTIRAQWVYDTLTGGKGKLTSATRYVNGNATPEIRDCQEGKPLTMVASLMNGIVVGTRLVFALDEPRPGVPAVADSRALVVGGGGSSIDAG